MKRVKKSQFGYIKYKRTFHLIVAIIMYAMAVLLYFAGIKAIGDNKNLLTISLPHRSRDRRRIPKNKEKFYLQ